ncbi:glycosyltransferase family 4 protein [Roseiconus nitratireducens]|uniref:Glycosyltransferase family 4 protein n=1 Tax=Roseiconus nitratireducens TaxID=2605748 RepID=A0A5M6DKN5_9BACT|nr:glycosyltransferase family 4 protein [Roseiconus nitratireducens]KAA5545895.1 glycosyltransferase family 4 protein [Roseiconus nitratireducens]
MNERQDAESTPLSILCVIHSLDGGGAERVMAGLASRLARRQHRVTLVTYADTGGDRYPLDPEVRRRCLELRHDATWRPGKWMQVRRRHRAVARVMASESPDVVLSFCDRNNIDVLMSASRRSPPIVICERSDPAQQSLGMLWNSLRRRVYHRSSSAIALTETSARFLRRLCDRVIVIPSAVDPPPLESDRVAAAERKTIVGVGRLEPEKGFDRLIEAFAGFSEQDASWRLLIYGEGSEREQLLQQADQLGIADRVALPGWVRPIWQPLSEATVFCLPSRYEGFPSALLEAMALGVPCISVDCESGPRAIIQHGMNGLLVEPSVEGLREGLQRWVNEPAERERLGRAGRSVVEDFGWDAMVDAYEQELRTVVRSRQTPRERSSRPLLRWLRWWTG